MPAWTDRVLWDVPNKSLRVTCSEYASCDVLGSDHRPVRALFDVTCA